MFFYFLFEELVNTKSLCWDVLDIAWVEERRGIETKGLKIVMIVSVPCTNLGCNFVGKEKILLTETKSRGQIFTLD
jgi:hypothetical protein